MFEKYAQHVQKHPKAIIALWVVALLVALPFAAQAGDVLNYDMTSMEGLESESSEGQDLVDEYFGSSLSSDTILVIPYGSMDELQAIESQFINNNTLSNVIAERFDGKITETVMGAFSHTGSESGVYMLSFVFDSSISAMDEIGNLRDAVASAVSESGLDLTTYITGSTPITYDTLDGANKDMAKIDPLSILIILLLLGLFFWTIVTAMVPPIVVGTAYGIILALMFALGQFLDIFYITKTIALVSMLGAGCDYSVFIIARYREERIYNGKDKQGALTEAIKWAGESVFTSGLAVIIGFAVMSLCSFSLVSTMAIVLALGIVMAMLAALSLIPAIIALVGDRIFWPRKIDDYSGKSKMRGGAYGKFVKASRRYFSWAGRFSTKHAVPIVVVAVLLTVPLGYVAFTSEDSFDMISVMPDSESKDGVHQITSNTDGGYMMPTYALIESDDVLAEFNTYAGSIHTLTWTDEGMARILAIQNSLVGASILGGEAGMLQKSDDNISLALGPTPWAYLYAAAEKLATAAAYQQFYAAAIAQGMDEATAAAFATSSAESYVTPSVVNHAIVDNEALPDMITMPLRSFFDGYNAWDKTPSDSLNDALPMVTVSGLIDYQLNVGAGLISCNGSDMDGKYVKIMIIVSDEPMSQTSMNSIASARDVMSQFSEQNAWVQGTWVLGTGAVLHDISEVVNSEFHLIEIGVIVLIYILLLFVLGVYFTPIRSLATIMMSVIWTLGALNIVFGMLMGVDVIWIVPIVLFVICLGLGMDYDILLTTRIREGKLKGLSNDEAIENALSWSGSIITLCGLIMGGTFLTMLTSGSSMLQEIGFALGFAILVDALFVVPYVVPALMHLMGDWSWKGPKFLAKRRSSEDQQTGDSQ